MRKSVLYLFAALLVVVLPLSSALAAGTQVYQFKDEAVDFCQAYSVYDQFPGPAAEFGQDVYVCYVGTRHSTVRVKTNKDNTTDVGWNSVITGNVTITPGQGGDYFAAAATLRAPVVMSPKPSGGILFQGNLQVEEVAQDDGNDGVCLQPDNNAMFGIRGGAQGAAYGCWQPGNVDYLMHHWKINGNSVFFFKYTVKDGVHCYEDTRGASMCSN
jgi:hypothetical protein